MSTSFEIHTISENKSLAKCETSLSHDLMVWNFKVFQIFSKHKSSWNWENSIHLFRKIEDILII